MQAGSNTRNIDIHKFDARSMELGNSIQSRRDGTLFMQWVQEKNRNICQSSAYSGQMHWSVDQKVLGYALLSWTNMCKSCLIHSTFPLRIQSSSMNLWLMLVEKLWSNESHKNIYQLFLDCEFMERHSAESVYHSYIILGIIIKAGKSGFAEHSSSRTPPACCDSWWD